MVPQTRGRSDWKAADKALSMLQCIVREDLRELCHLRSRWSSQLLAVEVGNRSGVDVHGPCDGVDTVAGEAALSVSTSASDNIPAPLGKRAGGWRRLKRPRRRSSWLRAAARCWCSRRSTRSRWVQEITSAKIQARDANQVLRVAGVVATRVGCRVHHKHYGEDPLDPTRSRSSRCARRGTAFHIRLGQATCFRANGLDRSIEQACDVAQHFAFGQLTSPPQCRAYRVQLLFGPRFALPVSSQSERALHRSVTALQVDRGLSDRAPLRAERWRRVADLRWCGSQR